MSKRVLLYERIYETLHQEIHDGVFQPGERLPTEHELMKRFEVSRVTTNRALKMLMSDGLISRRAGAGTFVMGEEPNGFEISTLKRKPITRLTRGLIGFVIPDVGVGYGVRLVATAQQLLQEKGLTMALACSYSDQSTEKEVIERLVSSGIDGLLIFPSDGEYYNDTILQLYIERLPMVIIDKQMSGMPLPYVMSDNASGASALMGHLVELGHANIAFMSTPISGTSSLQMRFDGYRQSLQDAGIPLNPDYRFDTIEFADTDDDYNEVQIQRISDFLVDHREVTAVFAARYKIAEHVHAAALTMGIRVPEDLSIVCFDGPTLKPFHWQFTHVRQDEKAIASEAVRLLTNLLTTDKTGSRKEALGALIAPTLVPGNTTGCVSASEMPARSQSKRSSLSDLG